MKILLSFLYQGHRLYQNQPATVPISTSIRCLKLNVHSALDIILRQNVLERTQILTIPTVEHFLPIIEKCLSINIQNRSFFLIFIESIHNFKKNVIL